MQLKIVGYVTANIEDLKKGDWVISRDQDDPDGELVARRITRTFRRLADHLQLVEIQDGDGANQTIRTTDEHPFHVPAQGWTASSQLEAGDSLSVAGEARSRVTANSREEHPAGVPVYNLEVEATHTYFVRAEGADAEPVWVHNLCEMNPARFDKSGRLKSRTARITPHDIGTGTATNVATRTAARAQGKKNDDAGHLIGKLLGGPGGKKANNFFAQNPHINRGQFAQYEQLIADQVLAGREVFVRVSLAYGPKSKRPSRVLYQVRVDGKSWNPEVFGN